MANGSNHHAQFNVRQIVSADVIVHGYTILELKVDSINFC